MLHNKRAVVGETLTWIVATLIIIVILVFSVFVTSLLSVGKNLDKEFFSTKEKDLLVTKSLTAYLLTTDESGEKVFEQLKSKSGASDDWNLFEEFSGDLAKNIFLKLYKEEYRKDRIWLGILDARPGRGPKRNNYFLTSPVDIIGGDQNWKKTWAPSALEIIELDETRWFVSVLTN